jgi:hypothetical protein
MSRASYTSPLLVALLATGCGDATLAPPVCGDAACGSEEAVTRVMLTGAGNFDLDVLFVVDDTSAIAGSEDALAAAYPQIAALFQGITGGLPPIHLGVAAASVGSAPSCDAAGGEPPRTRASACAVTSAGTNQFLTTGACGSNPSFTGSFADALSCLGDLGTAGCAPAQPLTVAREILEASSVAGSGWTGFLRPNAYLLLVFVAGQDDASGAADDLTDVTVFASYLRGLKSNPTNQILVAATLPTTACPNGSASTAPRLTALVSAFGANSIEGCAADLGNDLGALLFGGAQPESRAPLCVARVRDTDPVTPGLQADCVVDERITSTDGFWSESLLPSCDVSPPPCWTFTPSDSAGFCAGELVFNVDRLADVCPQNTTIRTVVTCVSCIDPADPACQVRP